MKIVLLLAACLAAAYAQQKDCGARADIVFVVDASGSVGSANFATTKRFIESVAKGFKIGPDDVMIGVVKYDGNSYVEFPLNRHRTEATLINNIKQIKYTSGSTATGKAIQTMIGQFTPGNGDRSNAPNIGIVITDGNSNDNVKGNAAAAKTKNIKMFAIGVGSSINQQQLKDISSGPSYVLNAKDFSDLTRIRAILAKKACAVATKPPTPKPTPKPTPPPTPKPTTIKQCGAQADIMFVVDASGSVGATNFVKTKQFMTNVARGFKIGPTDVQIGVVKYETNTAVEFNLKKHQNQAAMLAAINAIKYTGGGTQTGKAMNVMLGQFSQANGDRPLVNNIGIVITDGNSQDAVLAAAKLAKARGIQMFAIGIGSNINQQQLLEIATDKSFVLNVKDFNDLSKIRTQLNDKACNVATLPIPTTPKPTPPTTPPCFREAADIVFAIDASGSIGVANYGTLKTFVSDLVNSLNIGPQAVRVGMLRFSSNVQSSFHLNTYTSKAQIQQAINRAPYDAGGTRTNEALDFMRTASFQGGNGARLKVPKIAIIVTDGRSAFPPTTKTAAAALRATGVRVFAIGIGNQVDTQELKDIASSPTNVLQVKDFKGLNSIKASVAKLACDNILISAPVTPKPVTTQDPGCKDADPNCAAYGNDVCSDYNPWARVNCKCYCKFCSPCVGSNKPCVDARGDCHEYTKAVCTNPDYITWVKNNCAKFCNVC